MNNFTFAFNVAKPSRLCRVCISMKVLTVKHDVIYVEKYSHLHKLVVATGIEYAEETGFEELRKKGPNAFIIFLNIN
jgi:hypothetical protein